MAYDFSDKYIFDVIPNGVDTEVFRPSTNVKTENNVNILFVSRLIERKGLQHIIPLLKNIQQESNKKVCLTVVGDGPYKDKLERLIAEKQVSNMVMFEGVKKGQELVEQYQKGDIFILPSSNEGMPNVVIEAQTTGLPCLVSDTITEECKVTDKVEFLSLKNSALEWAKRALSMINNDTKREDYAGKMKVAGYDIKDVAKTFLNSMKLV